MIQYSGNNLQSIILEILRQSNSLIKSNNKEHNNQTLILVINFSKNHVLVVSNSLSLKGEDVIQIIY